YRSFRWVSFTMAAPVLVLRPPRGLHRGSAGDGYGIGHFVDLLQETDFQLPHDGLLHGGNRRSQLRCMGASHVRQWDESIFGLGLHADNTADRGAICCKDV